MPIHGDGPAKRGVSRGNKVLAWRANGRGRTNTDWGDVDATLLRDTVRKVTGNGGSVMFGVTSDGGAFSILVLVGDKKLRDYPHGIGECEESLTALRDEFDDIVAQD